MTPRIGSLFSGYGGLDMGVQAVIGGEVVWHVEFDDAPSKILKHHWPDIPNYGDITTVDWSTVPPVDVLTGGFPCQDVSLAGARKGLAEGTRSGLWAHYAEAINQLKPKLVVIENVRGLLSATAGGSVEPDPWGVGDGATRPVINALGAVLGDLADLGYDADWVGVRAADAGAPHGRFRVFIVAQDAHLAASDQRRQPAPGQTESGRPWADAGRRGGAPAGNSYLARLEGRRVSGERSSERSTGSDGLATLTSAADTSRERFGQHPGESPAKETGQGSRDITSGVGGRRADPDWGPYRPAIQRWELAIGRVAPAPTNADGKNGAHRLSARFVEWMMGLPIGHVTAPEIGLTRNQQLKALGNGVVPQQAALALHHLLNRRTT